MPTNPTLSIDTTFTMNDGQTIPLLGFGVFRLAPGDEGKRAIDAALDAGYRHIDTAAVYGNEEQVGSAIRASSVKREELFITTKCWIDSFGKQETRKACEDSLRRLGMEYIDLYLVHWPVNGRMIDAWETMKCLRDEGKCRSIGVSNFSIRRFEDDLWPHVDAAIKPAVNQIEWHPFCYDPEIASYLAKNNIAIQAYAPLTRAAKFGHPKVKHLAENHNRPASQILLRWQLQHGWIILPKSSTPSRIRENADLYDFSLTRAEMNELDQIHATTPTYHVSNWRPSQPWY